MDYEKYTQEIVQLMGALHAFHKENDMHITLKGEIFLLLCLEGRGGTALPGELATDTCVSTARTAALLKTLEKKGLLHREISPDDRRKILVTLTKEGTAYALQKKAEIFEQWKRLMDALGEDDVQHAIRILKKVHGFLENSGCLLKS